MEAELTNRYYNKFVNEYISKIGKLESRTDFIRDDSSNGIKSSEHIIYKLRTDDTGATHLLSKDGNRGYEFVIEFDKKDSAYGIYYGCKGLIFVGEQENEIEVLLDEWESIKEEVSSVLNNTFPDKDFSRRYKLTNNANNKTFWPFWISLYEEEDVLEVAARAVRIIYNVYKLRIVDGDRSKFIYHNIEKKQNIKDKKRPGIYSLTAYTDKKYDAILEILNNLDPENVKLYTTVLDNATESGLFEKDIRYEKCWRVKDMDIIEVHYLVQEFYNRLVGDKSARHNKWNLFEPILLSSSGTPMDLKRSKSVSTKEVNKDGIDRAVEAKERMDMLLSFTKKE